jgi:hypothetical protein
MVSVHALIARDCGRVKLVLWPKHLLLVKWFIHASVFHMPTLTDNWVSSVVVKKAESHRLCYG